MDTLIFSTRLSDDATYIADVNHGAFYMTLAYNLNEPQTTGTYKDMDTTYSWWNPANTTVRGMLPIKLGSPSKIVVNKYTLSCSTPMIYADTLFGIEDSILPVFDETYTILTDILFSSFEYLKQDEFSLAKACVQTVYLFMSYFGMNQVKRTKSPVVNITPLEL